MLPILFGILAVLLIPHEAFAWGAGIHLQLGSAVINNLQVIRPDIASLIAAYPHDFLYGCLAADITIGKKFTHYLLHCTLRIGLKVLDNAELPPRSRAPRLLAHLAADTIAHNYFVPYKIMTPSRP